jgi:hypothetical protein
MPDPSPYFAVRDPRSFYPEVDRMPLAPRLTTPETARFYLIQTMPPGSGLEPVIEATDAELRRRFPGAAIQRFMRVNFMTDDPAERAVLTTCADAAILFLGPAATMVHVGSLYAAALEQAGLPCALIVFEGFAPVIEHRRTVMAAPLRYAVSPNPPERGALLPVAAAAIDALTAPLTDAERHAGRQVAPARPHHAATGSLEQIQHHFHDQGWSDGLPIIPPTDAAVAAMLRGSSRAPDAVVSETMRPEGLRTTVEMVAINAVMAGAAPGHLPVILAAASLFGGIQFESMTRSVNSFAFPQMINGPIAGELDIAGGMNALGPGNRANAVIGRAVGLVLRNCGAQRINVTASPIQGNAAAFAFVFAENEKDSPWEPFHVAEGFAASDNTISLFTGGWAHLGNFYYTGLAEAAAALKLFEQPSGALLLLTPKRARSLAAQGLDRVAVRDRLWQGATGTLAEFRANGFFPLMKSMIQRPRGEHPGETWPAEYLTRPDEDIVPLFPRDAIKIAVVGSKAASLMQLWHVVHVRTAPIDPWR